MQYRLTTLALLVAGAVAQDTPSLTDALSGNEGLSQLTTLIQSIPGLAEQLGSLSDITILAPSNEAFGNAGELPTSPEEIQALLNYHVLNDTVASGDITEEANFVPTALIDKVTKGQVVEIISIDGTAYVFSGLGNNSTITETDINFTGGTIHVIDTLLTVPESVSATASAAGEDLAGLVGALTTANLVETLEDLDDVTIFAPLTSGFEAIASALQDISEEDLTSILTYHVVNGTVGYSADLTDDQTLTTVSGGELKINIVDGTVFVNGAAVVMADILVENGVVHVIDNVLNPAAADDEPEDGATEGSPAFEGASSAEVPFTSGLPEPTQSLAPRPTPTPSGEGGAGGEGGEEGQDAPTGAAVPMRTAAAGMAALFGGAAAVLMV